MPHPKPSIRTNNKHTTYFGAFMRGQEKTGASYETPVNYQGESINEHSVHCKR